MEQRMVDISSIAQKTVMLGEALQGEMKVFDLHN
jgi:hypothetical protein